MVIIAHYSLARKAGQTCLYVRSEEKVPCPYCGGRLKSIGSRKRKLLLKDGTRRTLVIRRLRCASCHRIHHELPDCVVPYRRYDEESIRTILTSAGKDAENDIGCENSTIMRIRRWFYLRYRYFEMTLRRLIRKGASIPVKLPLYPLAEQDDGWLKKLVRAVVNSGGWAHTRSAWSIIAPDVRLPFSKEEGGLTNGQPENGGDRIRPSPDDRVPARSGH